VTLNSGRVPTSLRGVVGCDLRGVPRFWLTFWIDSLRGHFALSTNRDAAAAVDRLYATSENLGVNLDLALARADLLSLEVVLSTHLQRLNNRARRQNITVRSVWRHCLSFVSEVLTQVGVAKADAWEDIQASLHRLAVAHSGLHGFRAKEPAPIRSLPSIVVMELNEIFDPFSSRNPFRSLRERFRNHLVFLMLLHLGLRRGELLILGADAFHAEFDPLSRREICWLVVDFIETNTDDEDSVDPRVDTPSLKNKLARRLLPVAEDVFSAQEVYLSGYRRSGRWPHLFISQKGRPLSSRRINEILGVASARLTAAARAALKARGKVSVEPHDLRHTAAVRRLYGYRSAGFSHSEAVEKLRAFFGWHEDSPMPARYARAYYETEYDTVWQDNYDSYVDAIRSLEVGK
jgi:integrase